ncbi:MAG: mannosylglycerate hydrolase [Clostridia bacterium]
MANNVHLIPHMHWDREWYFTAEESRILLVNNMDEIFEMLENNNNYPYYILDGQTAILEDYLEVKPENKERIKKLVKQGKLIIGPWYTQTDEMVVGGESIVRNLLYGLKDCGQFGKPMMIGYLPDSFGQSEKLPQILNGFDIKCAVFWRGSSERHGTDKHNFYWQGNNDGNVLVHLLPLGYAIGKYLPTGLKELEKRMNKYMPVLEKGAVNDEIVLPNGHDQMPIQRNIFEVIETLQKIYPKKNIFLSKFENIFKETEKNQNLATLKGEFLDGKYSRVHRSIYSSRADIKSDNTRIENKITNILEPLAVIADSLGFNYEHGLIEKIWKEMLKNHAHDSIGCCCSDKVHKAIKDRFFIAEDKTDELIKFYKRKITDAISTDKSLDKLTVFNLLPYNRNSVITAEIITKMKKFDLITADESKTEYEVLEKEIVDAGLIDRQIVHYGDYDPFIRYKILFPDIIPSIGFKTYLIKEGSDKPVNISIKKTNELENEFYNITVNFNGSLNIFDKIKGIMYSDVLIVEDGSDDGDGYDFSPLEDDFIVNSKNVLATIEINKTKNISYAKIHFTMDIPRNLDSRKLKISDSKLKVKINLSLENNSNIIKIETEIENKSKDHRVRMLVPNNLKTAFSVADNQFGNIKRNVIDDAINYWEKENWDERPDSIYPMLSYVATDNENGLAVLTNSVREYEIIGQNFNTIAITLFRSVGFLGKENLLRRPNRPSGIKLPTPNSQLIGKQSFSLALTTNSKTIARTAKEYLTPLVSYNKMPHNAMKLNKSAVEAPYNYSLFNIEEENFVLSTLKKAESEDNYVLRAYQTSCENSKPVVNRAIIECELNLNENKIVKTNKINLPINVVKTFRVKKG